MAKPSRPSPSSTRQSSSSLSRAWHQLLRNIRNAILLILILTALIAGGWLWNLYRSLPDVTPLATSVHTVTYDYPDGPLPPIPLAVSQIPPVAIDAVLAIEDRRYYRHNGVDWWATLRAAIANVEARDVVEGGSSITQQLAKNLFLTPEQAWQRKLREAILAIRIEQVLTKEEILAYYLNRVYFGSGAYGIGAATERYFAKSAVDLTLPEAALLAGVLQAPSQYSPLVNPEFALERRNLVLRVMGNDGWITPDEAERAIATPLASGSIGSTVENTDRYDPRDILVTLGRQPSQTLPS